MADITMCKGVQGAKLCVDCYRRLANENPWRQSYFVEPPIKMGKCDEYWDSKPSKESNE